jgi:hypothetical protein
MHVDRDSSKIGCRSGLHRLGGFVLVWAYMAFWPAHGLTQTVQPPAAAPRPPPPAAAARKTPPQASRSEPSSEPAARKPPAVVPQPAPKQAQDGAIMRQLEFLMLLEMMKDFELFYDDTSPRTKSGAAR